MEELLRKKMRLHFRRLKSVATMKHRNSIVILLYTLAFVVIGLNCVAGPLPTSLASRKYRNKILLVTFLFGEKVANRRFLQMFVETAKTSGVDLAIVGSPRPSFALPANVRHIPITWAQLVDRLSSKVFDGQDLSRLKNAPGYKVNDFKPLFAFLFEDLVSGYDWWGHVDNDIILGNVRHFLSDEILDQNDIISRQLKNEEREDMHKRTWGALTLYRNKPEINELFRLAASPLQEIFDREETWAFDEWGQGGYYNSSMSSIIASNTDRLGIRWASFPIIWDGFCRGQPRCAECTLTYPPQRRPQSKLVSNLPSCPLGSKAPLCNNEVMLCHYQKFKDEVEQSLEDPNVRARIMKAGWLRVSSPEGFHAP